MITNIVFDLGNVLLEFNPCGYLKNYFSNSKMRRDMAQKIFGSEEWQKMDRGTIGRKELTEILCQRYPGLSEEIKMIAASWDEMLTVKEETVEIAQKLKKDGHELYILSNMPQEAYFKIRGRYDFFELFTGEIISGLEGTIKPEAEIYQRLVDKYDLQAENCLFIDDTAENLTGARKMGFKTILFENIGQVKKELQSLKLL